MGVSKIVNPGRTTLADDNPAQACEDRVHGAVAQRRAGFGGEETLGQREVSLTLVMIAAQGQKGRRVEGHPAGSAELALAHQQQPLLKIHLRYFEL